MTLAKLLTNCDIDRGSAFRINIGIVTYSDNLQASLPNFTGSSVRTCRYHALHDAVKVLLVG